jgi:NAD(P)-dependent dehydrogenase (short-subunit alcohol dehydrogenase family)
VAVADLDALAPFRLDGKVAVVTGASSGLGARFARVLHAVGATVVVAARRADRLTALVDDLGSRAIAVPGDVASPADRETLLAEALERAGRVDVLVNNAGVGGGVAAIDLPLDAWRHVLDVNLEAPFHLSQLAAPHMIDRGSGAIVNVASILGLVGVGQIPQAAYHASKGALVNLTRELAAEWGRSGVRVNALCPGYFRTEINDELLGSDSGAQWVRRRTPMGRPGFEVELDGALLLLASDASAYMTGSVVVVDGGWTAI